MKRNDDSLGTLLYEGRWWVPESPKVELLGELFMHAEDGLRLRIKVAASNAKIGWNPLKVVHGLDQHGKAVTLFYATCVNTNETGALTVVTFSIGYCFHGAHFRKWAEAKFDEAEADFTYLQDWLNISGFRSAALDEGGESILQYQLPGDIQYTCGNGLSVHFVAKVTTSRQRGDFGSIQQRWYLRLKYTSVQPFKQIRDDLLTVRRFLTLGVNKPVKQIALILGQSKDEIKLGGKRLRRDIECFTPSTRLAPYEERMHSVAMLFSHSDIQNDLEKILRRWFSYQTELKESISLYFSTVENKNLYLNHSVLCLAQALEVYHRSRPSIFSQSIEPKVAYRKRVKKLTEGLSKADSKWLKTALAFSNAPTLKMRLLEILQVRRPLVGDFFNPEVEFAETVRDTRNWFTHWGKKGKHIIPEDKTFDFTHQMRVLIKVCFFADIGIPKNIIAKVVRKFDWTVVNFSEEDDENEGGDLLQPSPVRSKPPKKG